MVEVSVFIFEGGIMDSVKENYELNLHRTMCLVGGFMGAYALLVRCNNFGSAQTTNMIYIITCLLGGNLLEFLVRIGGLIVYFSAIELTVYLETKTNIPLKRYTIFIECICLILLSLMPKDGDAILCLYPLFFMMSTQWCVFHGANGFNSSTIFSTNNFKQFSLALGHYLSEKDEASLEKMKLFANSLIFFHLGVAASFFACHAIQIQACWFAALPIAFAFFLVRKEEQFEKHSTDLVAAPAAK
ncbi:MAG: YoaK family protein [Lachnospiraceae bacterium]